MACQRCGSFTAVAVVGILNQQFDGDIEDEQAANQFDELDQQQLRSEKGEADAQNHGESGTEHDADLLFPLGETLDSERDDDGVIACQQQVDQNDGEDVQQELSGKDLHGKKEAFGHHPRKV